MNTMHISAVDSVTLLDAFDPQALVLALQEGFLEHVQLDKGRFGGQIVHSVSEYCRTDWGQYNLSLLSKGDLSAQWFSIGIFLCGQGAWRVQGQLLHNGDLVVYRPGCEMCISLPPQAQWVGVQVRPEKLASLGFEMPAGLRVLHLPGEMAAHTLHQLHALSSVLGPQRMGHVPQSLIDHAHDQLQLLLWQELARRWKKPSPSAALNLQQRERLIQAVDRWHESNRSTPLRIDDLCQELEVPIWHLERAFQQTYGMSPQRLLTLCRLAKVRRVLLTQGGSVTEVALDHGFWHLGRFSGLYKSYFGESPSTTSRRWSCT